MKFRTGFVTNSSSSSFILVFDTEKDYKEFHEICEDLSYEKFGNIVDRGIADPYEDPQTLLLRHYTWLCSMDEFVEKAIGKPDYKNFSAYLSSEKAYKNSDEYKNELSKRLADTEYQKLADRIKNAYKVSTELVWDTQGGVLEWAIRNGFIESEFPKYCVDVWYVG